MELLGKNELTYKTILELFKTYNKVGLIQCTGSGKSYIGSKWVLDNPKDNFLIISNNCVTLETYLRELKGCNNYKIIYYSKLYLMSYQELEQYVLDNNISKCIIEEFHHTGAEQWQKGIDNLLHIGGKYKLLFLGLTATHIRFLDNSRNMFKELGFKEVEGYTYKQIFEEGLCGGVEYHSLTYIDSKNNYYSDKIRNSSLSEDSKKKLLSDLAITSNENNVKKVPEYVRKIFKRDLNRTVCKFIAFFGTVGEAKSDDSFLHSLFEGYDNVNIHYITCDMSEEERIRIIEEFDNVKEGIHILKSVNLLTEGLHTDNVNGVFFFRKTISPIVFIQQFGRCITLFNMDKVHVFDFVSNLEEMQNYSHTVIDSIEGAKMPYSVSVKSYLEYEDIKNIGITINFVSLPINDLLKKIDEKCISVGTLSDTEKYIVDMFYKTHKLDVINMISKPKDVVLNYIRSKYNVEIEEKGLSKLDYSLINRCPYEGVSFIKNDARLSKKEKRNRIDRANKLGVNRDMSISSEQNIILRNAVEKYGCKNAYKGVKNTHPSVVAYQLDKLGYSGIPKNIVNGLKKGWWKNEEVNELYRI